MVLLANIKVKWLELVSLALWVCVALAGPALLFYHWMVSQPGLFHETVNRDMKLVACPVQIGCIVMSTLLIGAACLEIRRHKRTHAMLDIGFALLAVFWWSLALSLTVPVK